MNAVIKFKRLVASPMYGNCAPGDILRCSEEFARHCVESLKAADYLASPAPVTVQTPAKPKRLRKAK